MKTTNRSFWQHPLWIIGLISALFVVPLVGAWLMAAEETPLTHKTTNHGQLLTPPYDFSRFELKDNRSQAIDPHVWRGHWLLLYAIPVICDAECQKSIFYLHQIRSATGRDSNRVVTAVLNFSDLPVDSQLETFLAQHYPETPHFTLPYQTYSNFVSRLPKGDEALSSGTIYVVDPQGNVLMVYADKIDPMDIFKDLTRLLKQSQIG